MPSVTFLEAAGDSLQLLTLVFALESRVGRRLPLDGFSAELDAGGMALALDAALTAAPMPAADDGVFLLPGARGDTPGLAGLRADCLGRVSMEMLVYPGWREMARDRLGLVDIAGALRPTVEASVTKTGGGPVTLIGYSLGAQVAAVLAFALEAAGVAVRRLVIIDMPTPQWAGPGRHVWDMPRSPRAVWWELNRLRRAERVAMMLARINGQPALRPVLRGVGGAAWPGRVGAALGTLGYWAGHHLAQEMRFNAAEQWVREWQAPVAELQAPVSLIRTSAHRAEAPEDLGWAAVAGQVAVTWV